MREHPETPDPELPIARPVRPAPRPDPADRARRAARTRRLVRAALAGVALVLGGVFAAALWIRPYDETGAPLTMASHTQLGMPPCNFVELTGKPCPSCGMSTSFALLVRGDVRASLRANWVGTVICVLWAGALVWAAAGAVKGRIVLIPSHRLEAALTVLVGVVLALMLSRWAAVLLGG